MKQKHRGPTQVVSLGGQKQAINQVLEVKQSSKTLDLFIYDEIADDTFDWWTGEKIKSETSADFFRQALTDTGGVEQINLFVNSAGGSVIEAMGIRAQLLRHSATVTGYVDGWAASAASFVLTGCDKIYMLPGSMQFLHDMWTVAAGNSTDLRRVADELDRMMEGNREMYLERSNGKLTRDQLIEMMSDETWLTAEACVEYGLADEVMASTDYKKIIGSRKPQEMSAPIADIEQVIEEEPVQELRTEPEVTQEVIEEPIDQPADSLAIFMTALVGGKEEH